MKSQQEEILQKAEKRAKREAKRKEKEKEQQKEEEKENKHGWWPVFVANGEFRHATVLNVEDMRIYTEAMILQWEG